MNNSKNKLKFDFAFENMYYVTEEEFRRMIINRRYKQGKITKETAFLELI